MNLNIQTLKRHSLIALLVLCMPLAQAGTMSVRAGSGSHATSSHSFKGGFSSQRSQPAPAPAAAPSRSSFGSFGKQSAPAAPANAPTKSDSALNRDLEKTQAQSNAMKSMEARQQAAAPAQPTSVTGRPLPPPGSPAAPPPVAAAPQPPVVVVQRESGSWGGMFWGYMLGSAMSRPHQTVNQTTIYNGTPQANGDGSYNGGVVAGPAQGAVAPVAPAAPSESWGWKLLRVLLWGLIIGVLVWLVLRIRRALRKPEQDESHYSLGKM